MAAACERFRGSARRPIHPRVIQITRAQEFRGHPRVHGSVPLTHSHPRLPMNNSSLAIATVLRRAITAVQQPESDSWNQRRDSAIKRGPRPLA